MVTGFIGGDSHVGTTMTAQAYAELLAERGRKTLLIMCSGKVCSAFLNARKLPSIDDLRDHLVSGHLSEGELGQTLYQEKNLSILPDVRDGLRAAGYPPSSAETLLAAAGRFEEVVLDLGNRVEFGLVVSGIMAADRRYLVVTQEEKALERSRYLLRRVLEPLQVEPLLIINRYRAQIPLPRAQTVSELLGRPVAGRLPYLQNGWEMEIRRQTLLGEKKYRKALVKILEEREE